MAPNGIKRIDNYTNPSIPISNPFSILDPAPQSPTEPSTRPPSPSPSTRPPTPQQPRDDLIWIPTELASIPSRIQTFQQWPLTQITPRQLARLGFYHAPDTWNRDTVCCFACDVAISKWRDVQHSTEELLSLHDDHCIWADLLEEMEAFMDPPPSDKKVQERLLAPTTTAKIPNPTSTQPNQSPNPETKPQEPSQPQEPSTPPPSPRKSYASVLKTPSESPLLPETKLTPASQSPTPAVLKTPTAKARRYSSTPSPTLTIDDLHNHFHNKPSPFKLTNSNRPRSITPEHQLVTAATNALSHFLLSALPAFTGFLSDIQSGTYNCHLLNTQKVTGRARGRSRPSFSHTWR